jgi:ABC-type transport system involved in multi-copper enzyme maturation permease subunit
MRSDEDGVGEDSFTEVREPQAQVAHINQLFSVFALQMRLYSKSISTYILIALALLVPILVYSGFINRLTDISGLELNSAYALMLMPLMIVAIPARFSGGILSSEFKNRTAFINFPLPMPRITFYTGKFLAAVAMSLTVMLLAVGGAVISSNAKFGLAFPNDIGAMLVVCLTGMIAVLAMTYFFGTLVRRGAGVISIALTLAVPFVFLMLVEADSGIWDVISVTPFFSSYQSLWFIDNGFLGNSIDALFVGSYSAYHFAAVSIAWCAAFFALGAWVTNNKEV